MLRHEWIVSLDTYSMSSDLSDIEQESIRCVRGCVRLGGRRLTSDACEESMEELLAALPVRKAPKKKEKKKNKERKSKKTKFEELVKKYLWLENEKDMNQFDRDKEPGSSSSSSSDSSEETEEEEEGTGWRAEPNIILEELLTMQEEERGAWKLHEEKGFVVQLYGADTGETGLRKKRMF